MSNLAALIADDEPLTRTLLRARLERMGHRVVAESASGAQAVEAAIEHLPDLAILDIQMPEMNGIEAAKQIMAQVPCAIVFLTGLTDARLAEQAGDLGACGFLMKPFRKEEMAPAIEVAVRRFRHMKSQEDEIAKLRVTLESRKVVERAKGLLMQRDSISEDEAFKHIHHQARHANKTMREIAEGIISGA